MKKKVIAYVHTHWDREWYREFEVFRLRLLRVFDNVLNMLEKGDIPSFYFDGQVIALLDYLKFRPEKEHIIRRFIKEKKLFIGPFYCLIDEFLTDKYLFEKNLEIGLRIARGFGCEDFIGYLADTFGHSANVCSALKKFGINKCIVWRGCGDFPSEFVFNGVNTVNLVRGYFMDIFSSQVSIEQKADFLQKNLDAIAQKSGDVLLLPIGADHLGVPNDLDLQVAEMNSLLLDYEIVLGSPFDYFNAVDSAFDFSFDGELRDNSKTFILPGAYSSRVILKQFNARASFLLQSADKVQKYFGVGYDDIIDYAYKLLLQNQAHDGICGCSIDAVHRENLVRYEKIIQIARTIISEIKFVNKISSPNFELMLADILGIELNIVEYETMCADSDSQIIAERVGVDSNILYDTQKIPVTEDFSPVYRVLKKVSDFDEVRFVLHIQDFKLWINNTVMLDFVRFKDNGDTYNFGPEKGDAGLFAKALELNFSPGVFQDEWILKTDFFDVLISNRKSEEFLRFKIQWMNNSSNTLWQVRFSFENNVSETISEDMNVLVKRTFDSSYKIREHLPTDRGKESKTNTAPMQRFVSANGLSVITIGLNEYEVVENSLLITLLRSVGLISNPKNSSRSTPAGPPIAVPEAQQFGINTVEFAVGFFAPDKYLMYVNQYYFHLFL